MSLHTNLREHAAQLARLDARRPKQANLRRAVSAAYYALFHLLAWEAARLFASDDELAAKICRTLNHGDMKKASENFGKNQLPRAVQPKAAKTPGAQPSAAQPKSSYTVPPDLKLVADSFIHLQELRHTADYDRVRSFSRTETLGVIQRAEDAFAAWERVRRSDDARLYLASFLLWERWDKEPR